MERWMRPLALVLGAGALVLSACGDDDTSETTGDTVGSGAVDDGTGAEDASSSGGSGAGTLVLDGEEIALESTRCHLEAQDAAAGGGSIEFVAQGSGTNAAGEEVLLDVSRYSEESMFAGDDVSVNVGPLGESVGYSGNEPAGTVSVDGDVVSAEGFPLLADDAMTEVTASFTISC